MHRPLRSGRQITRWWNTIETRHIIVGIGLGGAIALYLYSRTESGARVVSDTVEKVGNTVNQAVSAVRGIRNNNPGNIRHGSNWQGMAPEQTDSAFVQFVSMEYGVRAMVKILQTYRDKYALNTIRKIIARWAPPNENDTGAYVRAVAEAVGVGPDMPLALEDDGVMFALVRAIVRHENGVAAALLVSDAQVAQGIALA